MNLIKKFNLLVAFLLEIGLLILVAYWGFRQGKNETMKYVLVIIMPAIVIVLWGVFAAPKSRYRLQNPFRTIFKLSMFAVATFAGYDTGHVILAWCFGVITILNVSLAMIFSQDY
jgi:hypothetical protein